MPCQGSPSSGDFRECPACGRPIPTWRKVHTCRTCPTYSRTWAGDVRVKLFASLNAYADWYQAVDPKIRMVTVTAPGVDGGLPWDEAHCWHLGPHTHSGTLGCKTLAAPAALWNESAPAWWSELHRQARQQAKRSAGVAPELLVKIWEPQKRGVLHLHLVVGYTTPSERHAAGLYVEELNRLAVRHGFGYVDRKVSVKEPSAAAAYLSSYFVTGKGKKVSLRESVQSEILPRSIFYVARWLSARSGITMRSLRLRRYAYRLVESMERQGITWVAAGEVWWALCEGWSLSQICDEFI